MNPSPFAPNLTDKHCDMCTEILRTMAQAEAYCDQCEKAGLDMSEQRAVLAAQKQLAEGIKREFFPHKN